MTIDTCNNQDESPEDYTVQKKPISKSHILHNSIYTTFLKR